MRYFSQLTRETTARVMPARRPPWLHPLPALAEETIAEWPATHAITPSSPVSRSVPTPENGGTARAARRAGNAEEPARPGAIMQALQFSVPTPAAEGGRERAHPETDLPRAVEPGRSDASRASLPVAWPISTSPERREAQALPASAPSRPPAEVTAPRERETMPVTLQGIICELTRRQQELEGRYQADRIASRNAPSHTGTDRVDARTVRENESVLLNIDSIVVQVEPEHLASRTASWRPSPRRVPRGNRSDWKRSFLDR
jgi:hypothetical protein